MQFTVRVCKNFFLTISVTKTNRLGFPECANLTPKKEKQAEQVIGFNWIYVCLFLFEFYFIIISSGNGFASMSFTMCCYAIGLLSAVYQSDYFFNNLIIAII